MVTVGAIYCPVTIKEYMPEIFLTVSGEYFFDVFIVASFSQMTEPPISGVVQYEFKCPLVIFTTVKVYVLQPHNFYYDKASTYVI